MPKFKKNIFAGIAYVIFIMLVLSDSVFASKQLAAVMPVAAGGLRMQGLGALLEMHTANVIRASSVIEPVNPALLKEQLTKHGCLEEKCVLDFAAAAGMNIVIMGDIEDRVSYALVTLYAYGISPPYNTRLIYKYSVKISLKNQDLKSGEYSYICEEHAARFVSNMLSFYKAQLFVKDMSIDSDELIDGNYDLLRYGSPVSDFKFYDRAGAVNIKNNKIIDSGIAHNGDFIFHVYKDKALFLENYYYGRKRELVFESRNYFETALIIMTTVPVSAFMPLTAPLTYYQSRDFAGLGLWIVNVSPYLYLEYNGLTHRPDSYKENNKDISRKTATQYRFGIYMLLCGGMSAFIDSYAGQYLVDASNYKPQAFMGNQATAVYLSLVSGGGGLFFKGYRYTGYAYFHLNNILLYYIFQELSPSERYNSSTGAYEKSSVKRNRANLLIGAFGLLKTIEITHLCFLKDNIANGEISDKQYGFMPDIFVNDTELNWGAKYFCRF